MNPRYRRLVIPVALGGSHPHRRDRGADQVGRLMADQLPHALATGARRRTGRRAPRPRAGVRPPAWPAEPRWRRVELRYVDLKAGRRLQVTAYDDTQAHISNHEDPRAAVDELLAQPFANWHVETTIAHPPAAGDQEGRGVAAQRPSAPSRRRRSAPTTRPSSGCCPRTIRSCVHWASPTHRAGSSRRGRRSTARSRSSSEHSRWRSRTHPRGKLRTPTAEDPLRVVDLGCGNAYLTFAAHAWLSERLPVRLVGVDVKEQSRRHNTEVAESWASATS